MKRVIFLDVDGVLNNYNWALKMQKEEGISVYRENFLYEPSLRQLARIIQETGATIIISSAWRLFPAALEDLRTWLSLYNLHDEGVTPYTGMCRGNDITAWFNRNHDKYQYAILDDVPDMQEHMNHLILTTFDKGLTKERADACIEMLRGEICDM